MFKFLHAADVHLDSPLRGLERYEGAPVERLRGATRRALENLVDLALAERAAFVLLAGDLYDGDWRDYNTGLFLAREMTRLREAGIPVFLVSGNHDAASQLTRRLQLPDNVRSLPTRGPGTEVLATLGVAVHGQGFASRAVGEDLSASYPEALPGHFNIGLLHTSATGREGHDPYAPCTLAGLLAKGYDYWALGHVHRREVLHEDPWVLFPGNTQGRNIRETGPKGCTLVEVGGGRVVAAEHRDLDVLRWAVCRVDAAGAQSGEEVATRARAAVADALEGSDGRLLAVRLVVEGGCRAHGELAGEWDRWVNELRSVATDVGRGRVWVEKVRLRTRSTADLEEMLQRDDVLADLLRYIRDLDTGGVGDLAEELEPLEAKLPPELLRSDPPPDWRTPGGMSDVLDEVKQLLLTRLLAGGDTA